MGVWEERKTLRSMDEHREEIRLHKVKGGLPGQTALARTLVQQFIAV